MLSFNSELYCYLWGKNRQPMQMKVSVTIGKKRIVCYTLNALYILLNEMSSCSFEFIISNLYLKIFLDPSL